MAILIRNIELTLTFNSKRKNKQFLLVLKLPVEA